MTSTEYSAARDALRAAYKAGEISLDEKQARKVALRALFLADAR